MLPSYEAIYDRGRLTWVADAPQLTRARVIVTLIGEQPEGRVGPEIPAALPCPLAGEPPGEDDVERVMWESCGAWGKQTLAETEALIRQRRLADWGEESP